MFLMLFEGRHYEQSQTKSIMQQQQQKKHWKKFVIVHVKELLYNERAIKAVPDSKAESFTKKKSFTWNKKMAERVHYLATIRPSQQIKNMKNIACFGSSIEEVSLEIRFNVKVEEYFKVNLVVNNAFFRRTFCPINSWRQWCLIWERKYWNYLIDMLLEKHIMREKKHCIKLSENFCWKLSQERLNCLKHSDKVFIQQKVLNVCFNC